MNGSAYAIDPIAGVQRDRGLDDPMATVKNLKKRFPLLEGILQRKAGKVRAVDSASFPIAEGEAFGLVGESGSGETTTSRSMLHLTEPTSGRVETDSQNVIDLSDGELERFRRNIQIVHQDPSSSLNPRHRVRPIIETSSRIHDYGDSKTRLERAGKLLGMMDLPQELMYRYSGQLSGSQKQRVSTTRAMTLNPKFVVLDEPASALDVSVQTRIINILKEIQKEFGITHLFITRSFSPLKNVADHVGVMYLDRPVEISDVDSVFGSSQHLYSRALLSTISTTSEEDELAKPDRITLDGKVSDPWRKPSGCTFHSRCAHKFDACAIEKPELYERGADQVMWCLLHDDRFEEDAEWE